MFNLTGPRWIVGAKKKNPEVTTDDGKVLRLFDPRLGCENPGSKNPVVWTISARGRFEHLGDHFDLYQKLPIRWKK